MSGFCERLFRQLEGTTERFEVKLMMIDLISRLIGVHQVGGGAKHSWPVVLKFQNYVLQFVIMIIISFENH